MNQQPTPEQIEEWLLRLQDPNAYHRRETAKKIGRAGVRDPRIIEALKNLAGTDPFQDVCEAARDALERLGEKPLPFGSEASRVKPLGKFYKSRKEKISDFIIGFVGWFVINGGIWLSILGPQHVYDYYNLILNLFLLPLNLMMLFVLAFIRRWIALGILSALTVNLVIALVLQLATQAYCGIPFFIR